MDNLSSSLVSPQEEESVLKSVQDLLTKIANTFTAPDEQKFIHDTLQKLKIEPNPDIDETMRILNRLASSLISRRKGLKAQLAF